MSATSTNRDGSALERLKGLIERVTFHSPETGFNVLRVKVAGHRDLVTVVGTAPEIRAGEWLEAHGRWTVDKAHGQQFKAELLRASRPDSREGIEKYLASGLIKGIGPAFAARLVTAFGEEVFDVIDQAPGRLLEVEGIGPVRQQRITAAWREQKAVREIMVFLHAHGVGTSRAFRIYKSYGDGAIAAVTEDPYRLARDIRGIGFKSADKIAQSLGIDKHSDLRARAGVEHVLGELTEDGHCAYPRDALVKLAMDMLEIPEPIVERALDHAVAEGRLTEHPGAEAVSLVYLAALDESERRLAAELVALSRGLHPLPAIDVDRAVAWVEDKVGFKLAAAQREALALACRAKVLVVTGGPGVGKTTLVKAILKVVQAKKLRVVLAAPTGRAAKRLTETTGLEAKTIHRLLAFDPKSGEFKHDAARPLDGDCFVLDETSMLDIVLAHQTVRAVPRHAALILVGDVDQLPSVGQGSVLRDVIDSGVIPVCRLTEVFRQAEESAIIANAHRVNRGEMPLFPRPKPDAPVDTDFFLATAAEPADGVKAILRLVQERIPERFGLDPVRDVQVLTPMQRGELGARSLNLVLQQALNPEGPAVERYGWTFRVGDKVMQTVNDYDKDVYNGDIGRIVALDAGEEELAVRFDGREVVYAFGELDELALSYAVTVHKSQGSEYEAVVVPVHTQHYALLQRNLLYTAITRGKKLVVLVGTRKAIAIAVKRGEAGRRITTLKERLREVAEGRPVLPALPLDFAATAGRAAEDEDDYGA